MREFDAETVRQLLDELRDRLVAKGIRGTIKVAGGAAMLLNYPEDPDVRVTTDIDARSLSRATRSSRSWRRWHETSSSPDDG